MSDCTCEHCESEEHSPHEPGGPLNPEPMMQKRMDELQVGDYVRAWKQTWEVTEVGRVPGDVLGYFMGYDSSTGDWNRTTARLEQHYEVVADVS